MSIFAFWLNQLFPPELRDRCRKGRLHASVHRGKLRHRSAFTKTRIQIPCPQVQQERPRAAGKTAGRETLFCFLKLPAGTENTKSSLKKQKGDLEKNQDINLLKLATPI